MAALDFPASPTIGDRYPTPAVAGKPQYSWDGEKWTTASGSTTTAPPATATPLEDNATPQVGVTTKYAREDHVHPSTALKYSVQTLSEAQKAQSRTNVYAAPFDAQAYSGMQINGSIDISQEIAPGVNRTTNGYVCDGWYVYRNGTMGITAGSNVLNGVAGIPNAAYLVVTTAQTSLGASDQVIFFQAVEGYRVARLGWGTASAQPLTIGFWSGHHRPGVYSVVVGNGVGSRSYTTTYTHNTADIYQYNVVTIQGDTAGTWAKNNTVGAQINFCAGAGTGLIAPSANTWSAINYSAAPGQINGVAATSDVFRITGVVVLPGIEAPSAERSPLIMRPYDQELLTCMRYWEKVGPIEFGFWGAVVNAAPFGASGKWSVIKRATPTVTGVHFDASSFPATTGTFNTSIGGFRETRTSTATNPCAWFQTYVTGDARL